jgi:hypothetical protein
MRSKPHRSTTLILRGSILAAAISIVPPAYSSQLLTPTVNVSSHVVSDGISGLNPKSLPLAIMEYEVAVGNVAIPLGGDDSFMIANPIPDQLSLFVGDLTGNGSGPFAYEASNIGSGFECSFASLSNMSDCVEFSNDGGASFGYQPLPDQQGFDSSVTHVRFRLRPRLSPLPPLISNFVLRYRMRME